MIDWDALQITVLDEDRGVLTETERIYSMQAEQVMVIMSGAAGPAGPRGPKGEKGDAGEAVWGAITGTLSNQTDLQDALDSKPSDAPADDKLYGRQNGVWTPISSAGVVEWGDISGTLSDQTDLQTAINGKLSDAPSDGSEYVRKNGAWAVSGGAGVWGSIAGTLSDQTDLQDALDARLRAESVAEEFDPTKSYPAGWNYVVYKGVFYRFYGPHRGSFETLTNYEPVYVKTLIDAKANTADLGAMASVADAPSDGKKYGRSDGAWAEISEGSTPAWGDITGTLVDQTDLQTALSAKADASTVYTKSEADALLADKADSADLASKADASAVYTKTQVDTALSGKADSSAVYTKSEVDTALGAKANSADVTASLATKADATTVYTKTQVDAALGAKANTADLGDIATKDTVDYLTEIDNIPTAFPPEAHTHDDRYYTESEIDTILAGYLSTIADYDGSNLDVDTMTNPTALVRLTSSVNTSLYNALGTGYAYVMQLFYEAQGATRNHVQIAYKYNDNTKFAWRVYYNGWQSWHVVDIDHDHDDRYYTESEVDTLLGGKQNTLTFDSTPTASSANPVTSGGVKSALNTLDDSKVNKSGDTMTGSLQIKSSAIDSSSTNPPSSNQYFVGLGIYDKSNKYIGYLQAMRNTNGNNYLQIAARRIVNSQNKEASLSLSVDAEGNASCTLPKIISGTWEGSTINVAHGGTGKTTHTANAVLTGNGTSAVNNVATASGAFYATKANGVPSFGTLPVAQGGTGVATLTSGAALIGNGTNDITTRSITNNTSKNYITANTNLITANTLGYWNGAYNSSGNSNISYLGTISKGTWQGSAIGLNYGGTGGTDSGWQPYENSDIFIGTIYYRKVGVFFEIQGQQINLKNTLTAGGSVLLMTVPSTYRPSKEIMPSCFINNSSVQNRVAPMRLAYNGQLYLYANKTDTIESSYNLYFSGFGM